MQWDAETGVKRWSFEGHLLPIWDMCCVDDGDDGLLMTGSSDRTVRMWDLTDGRCERIFGREVRALCWLCVGCVLAVYWLCVGTVGISCVLAVCYCWFQGGVFSEGAHRAAVIACGSMGHLMYSGSIDCTIKVISATSELRVAE